MNSLRIIRNPFVESRANEGYFEIRDFLGLLVWKGTIKNGALNGTIQCYCNGQLVMEAEYHNNKKNGKYKDYQNGRLSENGYFVDGKRCGIMSDPYLMIQKQYENDREVYTQVEENGYRYIVGMNEGSVQEMSAYRITSDKGVLWFQPEGYSYQNWNGFRCLKYISYPDPSNSDIKEELNDRMLETANSMTVFSTVQGIDECLYMGQYCDSFPDGYPKDGRGTEYYQDFTSNYRINLNAIFHNNRIVSKGQFVYSDTQICVCKAEWDQDGIRTIVLFDRNGDVKYHGEYRQWEAPLRVNNLDDLSNCLPYYVSSIFISNVSTSLKIVDFSRFILAHLIMIGKNCFLDAEELICFHMPNLKTLIIGSGSFSNIVQYGSDVYRFPSRKADRRCIIAYCDLLEIVRIGANCFSAFNQLVMQSILWKEGVHS